MGSPSQFGFSEFLWIKASFSAVLGAAITPVIGLVALTEGERDGSRRAAAGYPAEDGSRSRDPERPPR